ncbi:radical SAM protein [Chitinivibrio alkaliphilus]|uniref:radical SAM protein n=1 Tax=Chitinivibrio alkaliphilus TaxID=1505232 RepID=UPI0004276E78|nr:radical SAM protein [Chitinivibrio alkaliphilus]
MISILNKTLAEFEGVFYASYGKRQYHSRAVYRHFFQRGSCDCTGLKEFAQNPALARRVLHDLAVPAIEIETVCEDSKSVKFTSRLRDGECIETVILKYPRRMTLCLSSQVGCRYGCVFCSTGTMGFIRNLTVEEIVWQVYAAVHLLGYAVRNVVYMGMGEPLDTSEVVCHSIEILREQRGFDIAPANITVSTAGHIPGLEQLFSASFVNLRIALSLHSCDSAVRDQLMPINRRYPIEAVLAVLEQRLKDTGGQLFAEYLYFPGWNNRPYDVDALVALSERVPLRLNLLTYNQGTAPFFLHQETTHGIEQFRHDLVARGVHVLVRDSRGESISAACGQLVNKKRKNARE